MSKIVFDPNHTVYVEKYRPQTINDCIIPQRVKDILNKFVLNGDFPCLMLSGGSGIGKTTVGKALTREIGMNTLLINISKERGIDTLRTTIQSFATTMSLDGGVKCIILDEFDGATEALQRALRADMEEYAINCRFIITCNHPNRIIDAIHSRSTPIDIAVGKDEIMDIAKQFLARCIDILKNEGVEYDRPAVALLIQKNFPDFRKVLNDLQKLAVIGKIDKESVESAGKEISIERLTKALKEKSFKDMRQWVSSNSHSDPNIIFSKVYKQLDAIVHPSSMPEVIVLLAQYQHYAVTAIDPEINLAACFVEIMAVANFV